MAGSLVKIAHTEVTSSTASVTLTGIDSTYDVYVVTVTGILPVTDNTFSRLRVTQSGSPISSSTYSFAQKEIMSDLAYAYNTSTSNNAYDFTSAIENSVGGGGNATIWLYNFPVSGHHKFINSVESHIGGNTTNVRGLNGAGANSDTNVCDGVNMFMSSGNISSGKFALYGLKKS